MANSMAKNESQSDVSSRAEQVAVQLRNAAKGKYVWRVQNKNNKSYCIEFEDYELASAEAWWKTEMENHPDYYENHELARILVLDDTERLMLDAAELLDSMT